VVRTPVSKTEKGSSRPSSRKKRERARLEGDEKTTEEGHLRAKRKPKDRSVLSRGRKGKCSKGPPANGRVTPRGRKQVKDLGKETLIIEGSIRYGGCA